LSFVETLRGFQVFRHWISIHWYLSWQQWYNENISTALSYVW